MPGVRRVATWRCASGRDRGGHRSLQPWGFSGAEVARAGARGRRSLVPTIFEVSGESVEAWTGWRMGAHLARLIGTAATWRVMQVLGEYNAVPTPQTGGVARVTDRFSRARFLKGVAGAIIAVSVLSGARPFVGKASARGRKHRWKGSGSSPKNICAA
jgi:hypothetical protein